MSSSRAYVTDRYDSKLLTAPEFEVRIPEQRICSGRSKDFDLGRN